MLPLLIVGGILLALAALLLAPVRLELSFREAFSAQVRYLFFRIPLASGKEEGPPPPQETLPPEEAPPKGPGLGKKLHAMLRREGLRGFLQTLQELAQAVGKASKSLLKKPPPEPGSTCTSAWAGRRTPPKGPSCTARCAARPTPPAGRCLGCCPAGARRSPWTWITTAGSTGWSFFRGGVHPGVDFYW